MKKVLLTLALAIAAFAVNAQDKAPAKKFTFGGGATIGIPVGDLSGGSSFTVGADLQGEYSASENFGLTISAGYQNFLAKNGGGSVGLIPVLAGARYYFNDKFFASAQAGLSLSTSTGGGSAFTYAPGIGYKVNEQLDFTAKYQAATQDGFTSSFAGIRVGYKF
jgi:hypothetical protein